MPAVNDSWTAALASSSLNTRYRLPMAAPPNPSVHNSSPVFPSSRDGSDALTGEPSRVSARGCARLHRKPQHDRETHRGHEHREVDGAGVGYAAHDERNERATDDGHYEERRTGFGIGAQSTQAHGEDRRELDGHE